jgi:hypothetical protein
MNHQKNWPLARLGIFASPPLCKSKKVASSAINRNFDLESEFKLVVAYDDFSNANRPRVFFVALAEYLAKILAVVPRFLRVGQLAPRHTSDSVRREAATVDIIVLVAREHTDLPSLAKEWMRTWKKTGRMERRRLLALFSSSHQGDDRCAQTESNMCQIGERAGMEFLMQATQTSRMGSRIADANLKEKPSADKCRRTPCDLRVTSTPLESFRSCVAVGKTPVNLQPTAVSKAIIEVMRLRQRKPHYQPFL